MRIKFSFPHTPVFFMQEFFQLLQICNEKQALVRVLGLHKVRKQEKSELMTV